VISVGSSRAARKPMHGQSFIWEQLMGLRGLDILPSCNMMEVSTPSLNIFIHLSGWETNILYEDW